MGEDLSKAAGAGVVVTIKGKEFVVSPLTMGDLSDFQMELRRQKLRLVNDVADSWTPEERADMRRDIINTPIDAEEMQREMNSLGGFRYILWKCLSKGNQITQEEVGQLVGLSEMEQLSPIIEAISGTGDKTPTNPPSGQ